MLPYKLFKDLYNKHLELVKEEIKINPQYVDYSINTIPSKFIKNKFDKIIYFSVKDIQYTLLLSYYPINNIETYHIIFTTSKQYDEYLRKYDTFLQNNSNITEKQFISLNKIISRETNFNHIYSIFKKLSWILFDIHEKYLPNDKYSFIETDNKKKIKFYRNIIKSSFENIKEYEIKMNSDQYYIYEINI